MTDPNSTALELSNESETLAQRLDEFDVMEVSNPDRRMTLVRILDRLRAAIDSATSTYGKTCSTCGSLRPRSDYYRDRSRADGLGSRCRPCLRSPSDEIRAPLVKE